MNDDGLELNYTAPSILVVRLNRPPVNAFNLALLRTLIHFFETFDECHPDCRCLVLSGQGRIFCAGTDIKETAVRTVDMQLPRSALARRVFQLLRACRVPTICALNGPAIGMGAVLAACCDIILASESAAFSLPEVKVGVTGGTRHLARILPANVVRYMALTCRTVDAAELKALGAVQHVFSSDALMLEAQKLAEEMAAFPIDAMRLMKEGLNLTEDMPVADGYRVEQLFTAALIGLKNA